MRTYDFNNLVSHAPASGGKYTVPTGEQGLATAIIDAGLDAAEMRGAKTKGSAEADPLIYFKKKWLPDLDYLEKNVVPYVSEIFGLFPDMDSYLPA